LGKRDALRVASRFEAQPTSTAGGRTVAEILDEWIEFNDPSRAEIDPS